MFIMHPPHHRCCPVVLARGLYVLNAALFGFGTFAAQGSAQESATGGPRELLIVAAASLADVLPAIAEEWSSDGPVAARFSFDATSRLAMQVVSAAEADVFVSADDRWMRWLEDQGAVEVGTARMVARNELVAIVPRGSQTPAGPDDLAQHDRIALGGENVPAGRYARAALTATGVWDDVEGRIVSGGSVRGVLEWVARAEVPVGVVYRTDALAEPGVKIAFSFGRASHPPIQYWAAPVISSADPRAARSFVDFVAGPDGEEIFLASGFAPATLPNAEQQLGQVTAAPSLPSIASAIRLSLMVGFMATVWGFVPAVGMGWLLARHDFPGKAVVSTVVLAPLVIPPVVTGFLLLSVLGTQGPIGRGLASLGLPVPFTILGATIASFIVGLPLYVLSTRGAFEAIDPLYEELSWTLGVPPRRTFLRISLPLALPGIAAGALLAFARALGEFGATVVLAGNVEGSTRTIALAVYTLLESPSGRGAAWTLVGASVALSLLALLGFEALSRRQKLRLDDDYVR